MRWILFAFLIAALISGSANAQTTTQATASTPLPISAFGKLPFIDSPELSPDGTRVAAKLSINGQQVLAIIDLFKQAKPVIIPTGENDLLSWDWVNDAWLVARIGTSMPIEGQQFYITRVVGVPAAGGKPTLISFRKGGQSASVVWTANDGSPRILMSMQKSVYDDGDFWPDIDEVDISTGKTRTVVEGRVDILNWVADASGVVRMGVGYEDRSRTGKLLYRPDGTARFSIVDRANRKREESLLSPILLANNQTRAFVFHRTNGFRSLFDFDLTKMEPGKQVFAVPGYDIDWVTLNEAGTEVAGVRYTSDRARTHWFDPNLAQVQAMLDKAVGARSAYIVSLSRDQKKMLVWVGDASHLGLIIISMRLPVGPCADLLM
jgi:hypothetical protein